MSAHLSKSKILSGLQCAKRLYLEVNRPDLMEYDDAVESRMATGERVNDIHQSWYPDGELIELNDGFSAAIEATRQHLASHPEQACFEATLSTDGILIRADKLQLVDGVMVMTEVKSSTHVKDYHRTDCAVQTWVARGAGVNVERIELAHIDNSFVYAGGDDYRGLLHSEDITDAVEDLIEQVPCWIDACRSALAGEEPDVEPGPQCTDPFDCPFQAHCWPEGPEYPLSILPYIRKPQIAELQADGYEDVRDIPKGVLDKPLWERVRKATTEGRRYHAKALKRQLAALPYPRYYLDFESINFAIPIWVGCRPFQQVPFQWSCHIETSPGIIEHGEFLEISGSDPRVGFIESLLAAVGDEGPILVWSSFEATRLRALQVELPDYEDDLQRVIDRIVDLLPIFKDGYYHRSMMGSWSIKAVLPALVPEISYASLSEVKDGGAAMDAFAEVIDPGTPHERREDLRRKMLDYCALDTFAMVAVAAAGENREPPSIGAITD